MNNQLRVLLILVLLFTLPGCFNIREVETGALPFISEEQAIDTVLHIKEVIHFQENHDCLLQTVESPTSNKPFFKIRVAEDKGDHLITFKTYTIDAHTGRWEARN